MSRRINKRGRNATTDPVVDIAAASAAAEANADVCCISDIQFSFHDTTSWQIVEAAAKEEATAGASDAPADNSKVRLNS